MLTVAGYRWISPEFLDTPAVLLVVLPVVFILGIIVDELGDRLSERPKRRIRKDHFGDGYEQIVVDLRRAAFKSPYEKQALEYARRRLRSSGWVVNAVALLVTLNAFVWIRSPESLPLERTSIYGTAAALLLIAGSVFATRSLLESECKILQHFNRDAPPSSSPERDPSAGGEGNENAS
jgi:hypothetical protein